MSEQKLSAEEVLSNFGVKYLPGDEGREPVGDPENDEPNGGE